MKKLFCVQKEKTLANQGSCPIDCVGVHDGPVELAYLIKICYLSNLSIMHDGPIVMYMYRCETEFLCCQQNSRSLRTINYP